MSASTRSFPPELALNASQVRKRAMVAPLPLQPTSPNERFGPSELARSQSKSQQLARAIAAETASPQYRPDSMWSEGGADVVWNGHGAMESDRARRPVMRKPSSDAFVSGKLSSPSISGGEFADADDGFDSDTGHGLEEGNTTLTTVSASGSGATQSPAQLRDNCKHPVAPLRVGVRSPEGPLSRKHSGETETMSPGAPNGDDMSEPGSYPTSPLPTASTFGHERSSSVGSSVWAGRGARQSRAAVPVVPQIPGGYSTLAPNHGLSQRASVADTRSSMYSDRHSGDWDNESVGKVEREVDRFLEENGMSSRLDMASSSESHHKATAESGQQGQPIKDTPPLSPSKTGSPALESGTLPRRILADGTKVPPMPPVPGQGEHGQGDVASPSRARRQRGRRTRSPILSYADGEAEEQRLELERDLRRQGAGDAEASNVGIRLKKNSPAPWELEGGESSDLVQISSRPSMDSLMPNALKSVGGRGRRSAAQSPSPVPFPDRFSDEKMPIHPLAHRTQEAAMAPEVSLAEFIRKGPPMRDGQDPMAESYGSDVLDERRRRKKSITNGATGVLKGMRLGASQTGESKKPSLGSVGGPSIISKAFRKASGTGGEANSHSARATDTEHASKPRKGSLNLSRGIGPEKYADQRAPSPPLPPLSTSRLHENSRQDLSLHPKSAQSVSSQSLASGETTKDSSLGSPPLGQPHRSTSATAELAGKSEQGSAARQHPNYLDVQQSKLLSKLDTSPNSLHSAQSILSLARDAPQDSHSPTGQQEGRQVGSAKSPISASRKHQPYDLPANRQNVSSASQKTPTSTNMPRAEQGTAAGRFDSPRHAVNEIAEAKSTKHRHINKSEGAPDYAPEAEKKLGASPENNVNPVQQQPFSALRLPTVGEHDGVPYKLISLEEARKQQAALNKSGARDPVNDPSQGMDQLPNASSERTIADKNGEPRMRSKKSTGFLRRLATRDRLPTSSSRDVAAESIPNARSQASMHSSAIEVPQLSVRPMSSMFNGIAPGMLDSIGVDMDSISERSDDLGTQDEAARLRASPLSPKIQIHAALPPGVSNAADESEVFERTPKTEVRTGRAVSPKTARNKADAFRAAVHPSNMPPTGMHTESVHSEGSSGLGTANAFPQTPELSNGDGFGGPLFDLKRSPGESLASAARNRAMELEARMSDLAAELARLRGYANEAGLTRPEQATSPIKPPKRDEVISLQSEDSSDSALHRPIPQCEHCGCHCAEHKRVQALNDLNLLKGISVLDRRRVLKPLAGENNSAKFGGYLDR